jgi:diadenosine tetraphosphate (Ap4A) HIT family hydrolase
MTCVFCNRIKARDVTDQNDLAAAFPDGYPLTEGHTLIVPLRHERDFFKLTTQEQEAIMSLARAVQERLENIGSVDGFNVGVNVGEAAGQTVGHAHVHIIPRRAGDVEDPRGGVRWVIPDRAVYWKG